MNGASIEDLLGAYVSGDLPEEDEARVESALADSPRLRRELVRYERLFVLFAAAAAEEMKAPAGLESRVARQVAVKTYLAAAEELAAGVLGAYGKTIIRYLGLA